MSITGLSRRYEASKKLAQPYVMLDLENNAFTIWGAATGSTMNLSGGLSFLRSTLKPDEKSREKALFDCHVVNCKSDSDILIMQIVMLLSKHYDEIEMRIPAADAATSPENTPRLRVIKEKIQ